MNKRIKPMAIAAYAEPVIFLFENSPPPSRSPSLSGGDQTALQPILISVVQHNQFTQIL